MNKLKLRHFPSGVECGTDEAGRGCLAGPVFAAAVILPDAYIPEGLNDSKKLSPSKRERLRQEIETSALAWAVASIGPEIIDKVNILQASIQAMHLAIQRLNLTPDILLVDGNRFNAYNDLKHICVVRGDAIFASIAAASILAKTHRDAFMQKLHQQYPMYNWDKNKGYPTAAHIESLHRFGPSPYHRSSFIVKRQTRLPI